ncbi:MAG: hypothetical protein J3R72DRAFT_446818 [Linnemannia gamsii]|nr:MAG: hypothetical protein J3R72DRAFT_446818 [Linnemannia gamsii]
MHALQKCCSYTQTHKRHKETEESVFYACASPSPLHFAFYFYFLHCISTDPWLLCGFIGERVLLNRVGCPFIYHFLFYTNIIYSKPGARARTLSCALFIPCLILLYRSKKRNKNNAIPTLQAGCPTCISNLVVLLLSFVSRFFDPWYTFVYALFSLPSENYMGAVGNFYYSI